MTAFVDKLGLLCAAHESLDHKKRREHSRRSDLLHINGTFDNF
jgi:hypothetical protein